MLSHDEFLTETVTADGRVAPDRLAAKLHVTQTELAVALGLSRDAVSTRPWLNAQATQTRLREVVEIINRVPPWTGSATQAFAWYRSQPLPSFGDRTAEDLVKEGRAEAVKRYLSRVAAGGHA